MPDATQSFNRYAYCLNNPLKYTDPTGEFAWIPFLAYIVLNGMWQGAQAEMNGGEFWDISGFWKGALIGAISYGAGEAAGMLTQSINVYGIVPGALIEGGIQGTVGGIAGGITNAIIEKDINAFGSGFVKGFATGFVKGALEGGIVGYYNAQSIGANPLTGSLYRNQTVYNAPLKNGIELQPDASRYCYAYSAAYADAGHGNRNAVTFIRAANYANGADAGQVFRSVDPANFNWSQRISGAQWDNVGGSLQMGREILGTTSRGGVNHWVNLTRITTADKWRIIGGGWKRVLYSTSVWDPISGHVVNGPTNFFSIVSLF